MLTSYDMCVTNSLTTRPLSNNILDHVVARTDDVELIHNYTIDCDLSDHNYILTQFKLPPTQKNPIVNLTKFWVRPTKMFVISGPTNMFVKFNPTCLWVQQTGL